MDRDYNLVDFHKKKVLVVDDNSVNRKILCNIFKDEYEMLQAKNGKEALEIINRESDNLAIVLLDIIMPVMNGFDVLDAIKDDRILSSVPIIAVTAAIDSGDELECLEKGAIDFVVKPINAQVVKHRVSSIINLKESAMLVKSLKFDSLTGAYSKEFFYKYVKSHLLANPGKNYLIFCTDIENFKLVNEKHGTEKGDALLKYIAERLYEYTDNGICGRLDADKFAFIMESGEFFDYSSIEKLLRSIVVDAPVKKITVKCGIYEIVDTSMSVSSMCDRAILAVKEINNRYGVLYSKYDDNIRQKLLKKQLITDSMELALKEHAFEVYLQPKHDITTGKICGAEALVRWFHPEYGFLSTTDFIPLFETNGFITKLDFYVWEEVCKIIKYWIDNDLPLTPISVNVSRIDFLCDHLVSYITGLTERYKIPSELLHFELTESAYIDDPHHIVKIADELRMLGFKIEIDDFGSSYSLLNMLSELPLDILKLDMRYLKEAKDFNRNRIISFVISLAKQLDFPVVAEGVETEEEALLLKSMGCDYIQGYYYAKPMPISEFERYSATLIETNITAIPAISAKDDNDGTVLVIESDDISANQLRAILETHYNVKRAENEQRGVEILSKPESKIDAILIGKATSTASDIVLRKFISADKKLALIPVLVTDEPHTDNEKLSFGCANIYYIPKPYNGEVVLSQISLALNSAELKRIKTQLSRRNITL